MRTFNIREFFNKPERKWPCGPRERFRVEFDDGSITEVTTPRLGLTAKLWGPLIDYDKTPLTSAYYLKSGPLGWDKIEKMMTATYKGILKQYGEWEVDREAVWLSIQRAICDTFYSESIKEYGKYVGSIDIFDLREIYDHPLITAIRLKVTPTKDKPFASAGAIEKACSEALKVIKTDPSLDRNQVAMGVRAGLVKSEQLIQMVVIRGFNTEIDSTIQATPIMGDYYAGINDPAEMLMDSSLASKAILFQGDPLKQTEYANRKLQFSTAQIDLLITGDCGTSRTANIMVISGRSKGLDGLFFVHPKTKKLEAFDHDQAIDWIGQELSFRLPIYCAHRHMNCICSTCYGKLALNVPYGTNLGTVASMKTMSAISQLVLKVKHVEGSVNSDPLIISAAEAEFIRSSNDGKSIYLTPYTGTEEVQLVIRTTQDQKIINGRRLPVLTKKDLGPKVDPSKFTQFREMIFIVKRCDGKTERFKVSASRGTRLSYLSEEFLNWFLDQQFTVAADGSYYIDLTGWDFDLPFLNMPNKHTSMKDFAAVCEAFIRSTKDSSSSNLGKVKQLNHYDDAGEAVCDMFDMITEKLPVHFSHVAIVALSMMVHKNEGGRWIPEIDEPSRFVKYSRILNEGSLGALFAYQGGSTEMNENIGQYLNRDRPQHLLDFMLYSH